MTSFKLPKRYPKRYPSSGFNYATFNKGTILPLTGTVLENKNGTRTFPRQQAIKQVSLKKSGTVLVFKMVPDFSARISQKNSHGYRFYCFFRNLRAYEKKELSTPINTYVAGWIPRFSRKTVPAERETALFQRKPGYRFRK